MPEKKDPYASPAMKVLRLYAMLLYSGQRFSLTELARKCGCSKQTVLRMIDQINRSKWEQVQSWEADGQRYFRAKTPQQRPNLSLDVEAIQHLLLCRDIVWHLLPPAFRHEIEETIFKTTVLLPEFGDRSEAMASLARNYSKGVIDYSKCQEILTSLLEAIQKHRICEVTYRASSNKTSNMALAPMRLIAYRDGLYIKGRLEKALASPDGYFDPTLAVHRILSLKTTERTFARPKNSKRKTGRTFGFMPGEAFPVKVFFKPPAACYVSERTWSDDQKVTTHRDGCLELAFTSTSRPEVISWVLSFGREAELLEPVELRRELKTLVQELATTYRG